ncbi:lipopolysaccharide heptosyltransferase I, partial [Mesorhizobium sp. M7A.F.Ca.CA.002.09.1.1]
PRGRYASTLLASHGGRVVPVQVVAEAEKLLALKLQAPA